MADSGSEQVVSVGGHRIRLTSLDKVLYPATGTTKAEVLDYYARVAEVLIPHARDRPATRKRWVNGVGTAEEPGQVFFQKNLDDSTPSWVKRRSIQHSDHVNSYPLVNDLATLTWLAQMNSLELHVPQWRFGLNGARRNPDRLVLDLDPGEGAGLPECVEVAKLVRAILRDMGFDPMPVTSGSKGIHLYAALDGTRSSDEISAVAHELARALEADHPDLVVSDMKKAKRTGKVLLDWSQNNGAKTTIVPYSLRGRLHPTVAAPRTWRELSSPDLRQLEFTEVLERVAKKGDPLAELSASHLAADLDDGLAEYRSMRDGAKTPEPMGGERPAPRGGDEGAPSFVIQEHHASRLHHDFRLERDGVLVSWAVPKGVPADPGRNHLAVHVEDHPLEYGSFEGTIPKGEYGAGTVTIWDRGTYELEKWRDDEIILTIHGEKHGSHRLALLQTDTDEPKNWLLHRMKSQTPEDHDDTKGSWKRIGGGTSRGLRRGKTVVGGRTKGAGTVHPMLAETAQPADFEPGGDRAASAARGEWAYEMKWDGYRAIGTVRGDQVDLRSRNGLDFTATYPELAALAEALDGDGVVDGEIVALDERGRPDFGRLQRRSGLTTPRDVERARKLVQVQYLLFDALELGGEDLTGLPYEQRRARLRAAVRDGASVSVPPDAGDDLRVAFDTSRELGLEGVVAKRRDAPYRAGRRSRDWLKLKHELTQEVVVVGWRPGNGAREETFGSLLLAIPAGDESDPGTLRYAGRVGTGFDDAELGRTRARLDRIARPTPAVDDVPREDARDAHWVTPSLVGEVSFAEVTGDGRLRQPVWRGWRPDKSPDEVRRED
ncbi:MAG: ATP-dependent DNA ligase [Actinomycetales bacterium]|nr:ATP-dependent DNA ligase [Actinomycetales bacterium]